jgi:hypothetical protein
MSIHLINSNSYLFEVIVFCFNFVEKNEFKTYLSSFHYYLLNSSVVRNNLELESILRVKILSGCMVYTHALGLKVAL